MLRLLCAVCLASTLGCEGLAGELGEPGRQTTSRLSGARLGAITRTGSKSRNTTFTHDALGRVVKAVEHLEGTPWVYQAIYGYSGGPAEGTELGNQLRERIFPDGERLTHGFDAAGAVQERRARLVDPDGTEVYDDRVSGPTRLDARGLVAWSESGDGTRTERSHHPITRRLTSTVTRRLADGEVLQAYGYRYDRRSRLVERLDYCTAEPARGGPLVRCCDPTSGSCSAGPLSWRFEHDERGALVAAKRLTARGAVASTQAFAYDAIGNLIEKAGVVQHYGAGGRPHALSSTRGGRSYEYDATGNVTALTTPGGTTTFAFGGAGMPTRSEGPLGVTERRYLGEQLWQRHDTAGGQTTVTAFLPGLRLEASTWRKQYGGAERESRPSTTDPAQRRGTVRFFHADHLGSATLVTDAAGQVVHRSGYDAWGEEQSSASDVSSFTPRYRFNFKEREPLTGVYDYGARLYDPTTGRFLSADPVVDGLDPYAYAKNDPVGQVDPSGHVAQDPADDAETITIETEPAYSSSSDFCRKNPDDIRCAWGGTRLIGGVVKSLNPLPALVSLSPLPRYNPLLDAKQAHFELMLELRVRQALIRDAHFGLADLDDHPLTGQDPFAVTGHLVSLAATFAGPKLISALSWGGRAMLAERVAAVEARALATASSVEETVLVVRGVAPAEAGASLLQGAGAGRINGLKGLNDNEFIHGFVIDTSSPFVEDAVAKAVLYANRGANLEASGSALPLLDSGNLLVFRLPANALQQTARHVTAGGEFSLAVRIPEGTMPVASFPAVSARSTLRWIELFEGH